MSRVGVHATSPAAIAAAARAFGMTAAARDRLTDDQIEQLTDEADMAASSERTEDVAAEMRILWRRALNDLQLGGPTPQLPTFDAGKLVMVSVTVLVGIRQHKRELRAAKKLPIGLVA